MSATHIACCPAPILRTQRPLWERLWLGLQDHRAAWRAAAFERRSHQALQGLSDETLRDIGMAERLPQRPQTLGLMDYERGRWS